MAMRPNVKFVQGNEACVEGALYAGLQFFAGYPITPSTEVAEALSLRLPQIGGKFIQMEDEIASMCAIIGASLTGHKVMTATSGPGFSLKQEALGYAVAVITLWPVSEAPMMAHMEAISSSIWMNLPPTWGRRAERASAISVEGVIG